MVKGVQQEKWQGFLIGLQDQIKRSAISVSSNIAEGFERGSKQELIQFLYIARGSCGELRSQFTVVKDIGYVENEVFQKIYHAAASVSKQLNGFIEYLKKFSITGQNSPQHQKTFCLRQKDFCPLGSCRFDEYLDYFETPPTRQSQSVGFSQLRCLSHRLLCVCLSRLGF